MLAQVQCVRVAVATALLSLGAMIQTQAWIDFRSADDGFNANFPVAPTIQQTTWKSEMNYELPEHIYAVDHDNEHYSVTVVDYGVIEQKGVERSKHCPAGAEPCIGSAYHGDGYWKTDMRGAVLFATGRILKRNISSVELSRGEKGPVDGPELHFINNADQSQTFAFVGMRNMKLYIVEGTVPKGYPPPALFLNSVEIAR